MAFETGSGVRICGFVVRKYCNDAKTFAVVTIDVPGERGHDEKIDIRSFKDGPIEEMSKLEPGMKVEFTAKLTTETLTNKAKAKVVVDDRNVWVMKLTAKTIKVEPSSAKPATKLDDDKMPNGW